MLPVIDTMSAAETREEPDGHEEVEEEQPARKRKISLSHCGVCGSEEAKYRCPACLTHSCSLSCVKRHKEASGCSGVRDKTAFVSLTQFNEMNLLSDYRFLEDTSRFADGATRDDLVRTRHTTLKAKKLAASARKMNITLRFLPVSFTKSRENSTFFFTKEKQFMWHLKLVFPQSSSEFSQRRVSDRQTLKQILTSYIHPTESDPVTRQKLKTYVRSSFDHVKVFMKAEGRKANSVRFHELDIEKSLRDNLSYKMLIEYPVLHVVCREHWKDYPLKGPAGTKTEGVNQQDDVKESGSNIINTTTRETELKPPTQKRVKTGDLEEGEVVDSSDEDGEEDENSCDVNKDAVGDNLDADVGIRVNTDDASAADAMKQPEPVDTHH